MTGVQTCALPICFPVTISGAMSVFPIRFLSGANISFISKERMNFVGHSKYLQNTIYATIGEDNHLYLKSPNPQFMYLEKVKAYAVFEDVSKAYELGCETENDKCEILDTEFPLEAPLINLIGNTDIAPISIVWGTSSIDLNMSSPHGTIPDEFESSRLRQIVW